MKRVEFIKIGGRLMSSIHFFKFKKIILLILLFIMMVFLYCYDGQKEDLRKELNQLGKSISKLTLDFNKISDDQKLNSIEDDFDRVDNHHQKVYERIINNNVKLKDDVTNYYKENYIPAFQKVTETINNLLEGDFSDASFKEHYNKAGQNLNELIRTHNNFIGMLEK